jgi:hypothetical protein
LTPDVVQYSPRLELILHCGVYDTFGEGAIRI